jgi:hypothetical protein
MLPKSSPATRWSVLAISVVASVICASWLMRLRRTPESDDLVAMSDDVRELYRRRASGDPRPATARGGPDSLPALVREPLDEATATPLFPEIGRNAVFDAALYYRRPSNVSVWRELPEYPGGGFFRRTNSLGMRENAEPLAARPDWRILVTGASNVEGMCANDESATHVLEALLAERMPGAKLEALNAAVGSYNLYNDLAVLEHYRDLKPDVFVLAAYGGNDFFGCARIERYFDRRGPAETAPYSNTHFEDLDPFTRSVRVTELAQVTYFQNNPEDFDVVIGIACSLTAEMARVCAAQGVRFVCAYLPPPMQGQPEVLAATRRVVLERLRLSADDLAVSDRIADQWLEFVERRGIAHVDLRPAFRASQERLYWTTNAHINVVGQRLIAQALLPLVAPSAQGH